MAESNLGNTQYFRTKPDQELQVKEVLDLVYTAMDEKGYNPVNQIVGYIMSGDPTYITSHKGARSMIMKVERDELVEELLNEYIKNKSWSGFVQKYWVLPRLLSAILFTSLPDLLSQSLRNYCLSGYCTIFNNFSLCYVLQIS